MKNLAAGLIAISCSFAFWGCLGNETSEPLVLEPHAVGNEWSYDYQDGQNVVGSEVTQKQSVTLETGERIIVYKLVEGETQVPRFATNGPQGLYTVYRLTADGPYRQSLHLKHPAEIGETWTAVYPAHESGASLASVPERLQSIEYTLVAKDQDLVTRAGTFRCNVYRSAFPDFFDPGETAYSFRFFAPGIGLVGESLVSPDSTMPDLDTTDLISLGEFTLK